MTTFLLIAGLIVGLVVLGGVLSKYEHDGGPL